MIHPRHFGRLCSGWPRGFDWEVENLFVQNQSCLFVYGRFRFYGAGFLSIWWKNVAWQTATQVAKQVVNQSVWRTKDPPFGHKRLYVLKLSHMISCHATGKHCVKTRNHLLTKTLPVHPLNKFFTARMFTVYNTPCHCSMVDLHCCTLIKLIGNIVWSLSCAPHMVWRLETICSQKRCLITH